MVQSLYSIINTVHAPQQWLIQCPSTVMCPTKAGDLLLLSRELVVISDLFCGLNVPVGIDDNLVYYSSKTVGL